MMNTETIKQEIKKLIEKYNRVVEEKRVSKYNEEMTKKDFILPLFHALGWNTEDSNEVTAEEKISKKRVDYGFRINGIPKFFLEAKSLKEDLDNPKFIEQAINYAWHKGCTWAVLTDFESMKIFNAEWKTSNALQSHLKTIPCQEFLDRFSELWLLSRQSFEQGLIDKEAEKWGKKTKKTSVDKQLLADFTRFRELLSKNITKLNQSRNITEEDLDESIQRILDRLIFIRNCEDRELEARILISSFREWESRGRGQLIKSLREVFAYFDKQYNSKIFANHLCDSLDIDNEVLHEIIEGLYFTKDKSVSYDFSAIEADVLGNIYEQYLGHILKKSEKRAKLTENHAHRKEQGIYYTPTYIVDYIVRNTLGELLKDKKIDAEKIRVLDPACGSGSFLIKAFDVLNEHYAKHDKNYSQTQIDFKTNMPFTTKTKILKNNIFGVDLDKQAVEIAQLNLLLKIAEKGHRLPLLQENIKCGNSLIDNPAIAEDKAFNWDDEFPEVMAEGGFDVVIGNPPWVSFGLRGVCKIDKAESEFYRNYYLSAEYKLSTYSLFIERAIILLSDQGYFSFILPDSFLLGRYFSKLRKFILDNCQIKKILLTSYDVFSKEATTGRNVILILKKEKNEILRAKNLMDIIKVTSEKDFLAGNIIKFSYQQEYFEHLIYNRFRLFFNKKEKQLVEKIEKDSKLLGKFMTGHTGVRALIGQKNIISKNKKTESWKRGLISGSQIRRYWLKYEGDYINIDPKLLNKGGWDPKVILNDKLMIRQTGDRLYATIDTNKYYHLNNIHSFNLKDTNLSIKYILALLNSKLMSAYYLLITLEKGRVMAQTDIETLEKLPIKPLPEPQQQPLIKLVDKMLSLNKRLNEIGDKKTDERAKIEEEIKKTDAEINELVYKIYGITAEEKKVIEESFKN